VVGCCECGDEPSDSIEWGDFLSTSESVSSLGRTLLHGVCLLVLVRGTIFGKKLLNIKCV
jgi:hypothetical protein